MAGTGGDGGDATGSSRLGHAQVHGAHLPAATARRTKRRSSRSACAATGRCRNASTVCPPNAAAARYRRQSEGVAIRTSPRPLHAAPIGAPSSKRPPTFMAAGADVAVTGSADRVSLPGAEGRGGWPSRTFRRRCGAIRPGDDRRVVDRVGDGDPSLACNRWRFAAPDQRDAARGGMEPAVEVGPACLAFSCLMGLAGGDVHVRRGAPDGIRLVALACSRGRRSGRISR